jgi:hypothetical protein
MFEKGGKEMGIKKIVYEKEVTPILETCYEIPKNSTVGDALKALTDRFELRSFIITETIHMPKGEELKALLKEIIDYI